MRVIGLTGGIATGKSTFAAALRTLGVPVVDADVLARQVVEPGRPALEAIVRTFGREVVGADGTLDRKKLGQKIFAEPLSRRKLEAITHPAIREAMIAETIRLDAAGHDLAFYDAPLLFEVGLDQAMDSVVVVYAPRAAQVARLAAREGASEADAQARLAAQWPIDEKAARADFVVDNTGGVGDLGEKASRLVADLRRGLGRRLPNAPPVRY
ncbi:MAG: dephospho-CoA kinase [Anaeromyxobacter sp.]